MKRLGMISMELTNKLKRFIFIVLGFVFVGIGMIGVVVPVMPTTVFLLIASFFFMKGSDRIDRWFKGTKLYKKHLEEFLRNREMKMATKIKILLFASCMILISIFMIEFIVVRLLLLLIIAFQYYYFFFKIKTAK